MTIRHQSGPFAIVPLWVHKALIEHDAPQALSLYVALHEWTAGADRKAHPGRLTLAAACGVSERTIDAYVKVLVAVGALRVEPRWTDLGDRTSNDYTILIAPPGEADVGTPGEADVGTGGTVDCAGTRPSIEPDPTEPDSLLTPAEMSDDFDAWWALYPRKVGKKHARVAWRNMTKTNRRAAMHTLPNHIAYWVASGRGTETIPHPTSWLHAEAWNDEVVPVRASTTPRATRHDRQQQVYAEFLARHANDEADQPALPTRTPLSLPTGTPT